MRSILFVLLCCLWVGGCGTWRRPRSLPPVVCCQRVMRNKVAFQNTAVAAAAPSHTPFPNKHTHTHTISDTRHTILHKALVTTQTRTHTHRHRHLSFGWLILKTITQCAFDHACKRGQMMNLPSLNVDTTTQIQSSAVQAVDLCVQCMETVLPFFALKTDRNM